MLRCVVFLLVLAAAMVWGCSSSKPASTTVVTVPPEPTRDEPAPPPPASSPTTTYAYRITNDGCNCEEYTASEAEVEYRFRANYRMDTGILTSIEIEFENESDDTLYFDRGTLRIASRNVKYQYNNKFIPIGDIVVPPHDSYSMPLQGKEITDRDNWHKIAGEQLSLTLRGLRLGDRQLKEQTVNFIPENPNFRN